MTDFCIFELDDEMVNSETSNPAIIPISSNNYWHDELYKLDLCISAPEANCHPNENQFVHLHSNETPTPHFDQPLPHASNSCCLLGLFSLFSRLPIARRVDTPTSQKSDPIVICFMPRARTQQEQHNLMTQGGGRSEPRDIPISSKSTGYPSSFRSNAESNTESNAESNTESAVTNNDQMIFPMDP